MKPNERRAFFRNGLSTLYLPFYDDLCTELPPDWQPYSSNRTIQEQSGLYAIGRTTNPLGIQYRRTNAPGGYSPHNYGAASDWTWFDGTGHLCWLSPSDLRWQEYVDIVEKVGLRSGKYWGDTDHNELHLTCDWSHIYQIYSSNGMTSAQQHMEDNLVKERPNVTHESVPTA